MTTPDGNPPTPVTSRQLGFEAGDAAVQSRPVGGGAFTGGGEARVVDVNQDVSTLGAADASSSLVRRVSNIADKQAASPQFVRDPE